MNLENFREYCLSFENVTENFPFDKKTLVFKINNKMFALCDVNNFESINLKCDPEKAIELRERYCGIKPGYHMNKKHWNTVEVNSDVPENIILELVKHSFELVFK